MIEHAEGHRVLVGLQNSSDERSCFVSYWCEDPTCDWHVTEFTGSGSCSEFVNPHDEALTDDVDRTRVHSRQRRRVTEAPEGSDSGQTSFWQEG